MTVGLLEVGAQSLGTITLCTFSCAGSTAQGYFMMFQHFFALFSIFKQWLVKTTDAKFTDKLGQCYVVYQWGEQAVLYYA